MAEGKKKILILVEGEKNDKSLMDHLLCIYQFDSEYEIVAYMTNIYTLYKEMFVDGEPYALDLLQVLKARELNEALRTVFDVHYTDILLIFDFEPHDPQFSPDKIQRLMDYFVESSDMGKLYLNYPMVEAFYHMKSIPDSEYDSYYVTLQELRNREYKARVNRENRNHDYRKFAVTKEECNTVIRQNIEKSHKIIGVPCSESLPVQQKILSAQLKLFIDEQKTSVLSTCCFFIPEYNPKLIN